MPRPHRSGPACPHNCKSCTHATAQALTLYERYVAGEVSWPQVRQALEEFTP